MEAPIFNFSNGWFYQMNEPGWLIAQIEKRLAESSCSDEDRKQLKNCWTPSTQRIIIFYLWVN